MQMDTAFAVPFMKRDDETLYDYCLSFSPAAPFFGVPWRFAETLKVAPSALLAPKAKAKSKAKVKIVAEPVEDAVAVTEAVEAAVDAAVEAAPAPVEIPEVAAPVEEAVAEVEAAVAETAEAVTETVAETVEAVEAPVEAAADAAVAPEGLFAEAPSIIDDLKLIKGVGPKLEAELNAIGIYTFAQIAAMTQPQLVWIDEQISSVRGRPVRDDWAGQAKALAG